MQEQDTSNTSKQSASEILSDSVKEKYNFFLHFSKPYTDAIDNGTFFQKPVSWIYALFGGLCLLSPFIIAAQAIDNHFFDAPSKYIFMGLLFWAIITLVGLINFQICINRKNKLLKLDGSRGFLATKIMANVISTMGECYVVSVGILGFFASFLSLFTDEFRHLTRAFSDLLPFGEIGLVGLILLPILGYIIIISFRFFSELIMGIAQIARNTAK
jgi:hypothetical protein